MNKKGFSLIELMTVVAIIAILAAIALPMYSAFMKRSKATNAIAASEMVFKSLQEYHSTNGDFTTATLGAGNRLDINGISLGVAFPPKMDGKPVTWTVLNPQKNVATVSWTMDSCPQCAGTYCLVCDDDRGCSAQIRMAQADLKESLNRGNIALCP